MRAIIGGSMGKKKNEMPKTEPCLTERYSQFCNEFQKASNKPKFILDFFNIDHSTSLLDDDKIPTSIEEAKNEDVKVIALCKNKDVQKILFDLGNRGADVVAIYNCIKFPELCDYELERLPQTLDIHPDALLHPQFNEMIEQVTIGQKEYKKREKALHGAIKLICSLEPIRMIAVDELRKYHPDFNERLAALQKEFEAVITLYIEHAPFFRNKAGEVSGYIASNFAKPISKMHIPKKITSKSPYWIERIIIIVNELKRIGFSAKRSYKKTMDLFILACPEIWKDNDPDLIRQRYTYHTKTKK
jgi:hypothetical protein